MQNRYNSPYCQRSALVLFPLFSASPYLGLEQGFDFRIVRGVDFLPPVSH